MPTDPTMCWIDDRLVPWSEARLPVEDRGLQFGESVYEVVPVTRGRPRLLSAHAERLAAGAAALELAAPSVERIHEVAGELISTEAVDEGLMYLQLTGGSAPRDHLPAPPPRPTFISYLRPHRFPRAADVDRGLRVATVPDERWARCDLKTTMLLPAVFAKRQARERGADEAILLAEDDTVREGASTSVIAVLDGRLTVPEPSSRRLPGTMSALVETVAAEAGLVLSHRPLSVTDLARASEVLVTATSKLVMPVVSVDDRPVGDGTAGPVGRDLAARVRRRFELE
jgi:D-alanine transaminase